MSSVSLQEVPAARALARPLRRRLRPPASVLELVLVPRLDATRGRLEVMRACRDLLARAGYTTLTVVDGWTGEALNGPVAAERLHGDEQRAEHDDYWWSGDVCWSRADGATVVAPERTEWRTLRFLAWGVDATDVMHALSDAIAP